MAEANPTTDTTELAALLAEANGVLDTEKDQPLPEPPADPGPFYAWEQVYQAEDGNQYRRVIATNDDPQPTWAFRTPSATKVCAFLKQNQLTFDTRSERDAALCN